MDCRPETVALTSLNIWCFQLKMHLQPDVVLRPGMCPADAKATAPFAPFGAARAPPRASPGALPLPWSVLSRLKAVTEKGCCSRSMSGTRDNLSSDCGHMPGLPGTRSGGKASPGEEPRRLGPPTFLQRALCSSQGPGRWGDKPRPGSPRLVHRSTCACTGFLTPSHFPHLSCFPACPMGGKVGDQKCVIVP